MANKNRMSKVELEEKIKSINLNACDLHDLDYLTDELEEMEKELQRMNEKEEKELQRINIGTSGIHAEKRRNNWHNRNVADLEDALVYYYLSGAKKIIEEGGKPFKLSDKEFFNETFIPDQIEKGLTNHNIKWKGWDTPLPEHKPNTWDRISHKRICGKALSRVKWSDTWKCIAEFRNIKTSY